MRSKKPRKMKALKKNDIHLKPMQFFFRDMPPKSATWEKKAKN